MKKIKFLLTAALMLGNALISRITSVFHKDVTALLGSFDKLKVKLDAHVTKLDAKIAAENTFRNASFEAESAAVRAVTDKHFNERSASRKRQTALAADRLRAKTAADNIVALFGE